MFKLVVLCAFLAAVVAEPSAIIAPLAYSTYVSPATTTITNQASSVIHPSPLVYPGFLGYNGHFIKKRSPGLISSYIAPSTYIAHTPYTYAAPLTTAYTAVSPLATTYTAPVYTAAAHLIKKRSVLLKGSSLLYPTSYVAPAYAAAPLVTSTYTAAAPVLSTPYLSAAPISYTHLIKKRSAPLISTYVTPYAVPAAVSHQSRLDIHSSPAVASSAYSTPLSYASPVAISHVI